MLPRIVAVIGILVVAIVAAVGISGQFLFANATDDPLKPADAVVVLGGEHDGRELYGIRLAHQIGARYVLLSNPYPTDDRLMTALCDSRPQGLEVLCRRPVPADTRGEAIMARESSEARGWRRIVVVSWRYHMPRIRLIFRQCYTQQPGVVTVRSVPRNYEFPFGTWEYISFYQYAGLAKAAMHGSC